MRGAGLCSPRRAVGAGRRALAGRGTPRLRTAGTGRGPGPQRGRGRGLGVLSDDFRRTVASSILKWVVSHQDSSRSKAKRGREEAGGSDPSSEPGETGEHGPEAGPAGDRGRGAAGCVVATPPAVGPTRPHGSRWQGWHPCVGQGAGLVV